MVDVIFKKNYFEELPDDIKDKILKKVKDMKFWDKINKGNLDIYRRLKKAKDIKNVYRNFYYDFTHIYRIIRDNIFRCKSGGSEGDIFYYTNLKIFCDIVKKIIILYNFDEVLAEKVLIEYCGDTESGIGSFLYDDCFSIFSYIIIHYNKSHIRYLYRDLLWIDEDYVKTSKKYDRYFYIKVFLKSELKTFYLIKELYDYFEYCFNKGFMIKRGSDEESIDDELKDILRYINNFELLIDIKNKRT